MRKAKYDEKIIKMLEKSGGMKASTVAAQLGVRPTTIYKVLTRMLEQGRVVKEDLMFKLAGAVEDVSDLVARTTTPARTNAPARTTNALALTLIEEELRIVNEEISELERELHVLREIHNRLTFILGNAR
jgi:DeoR/GlpR family transcriptional regulator of sugar metabolism